MLKVILYIWHDIIPCLNRAFLEDKKLKHLWCTFFGMSLSKKYICPRAAAAFISNYGGSTNRRQYKNDEERKWNNMFATKSCCIAVHYVEPSFILRSPWVYRPTLGLDQVAFLAIIFSQRGQINGLLFHRFFCCCTKFIGFFKSIMFHKSQKSLSKECNFFKNIFSFSVGASQRE